MLDDFVERTLTPVTHDLGGFKVHRTLPAKERTMVGPFLFFDQMGPAHLPTGGGIDVRPHPHINLATVTYLFEGAIDHRDSLGTCARERLTHDLSPLVLALDPGARRVRPPRAGRISATRSTRSPRASAARSPPSAATASR